MNTLEQFDQQQQIILEAIQTGLQDFQTCTSQTSMVSRKLAISASEATDMLCAKTSSEIVMPDGVLTTKNEADRPIVSALKGVELNLEALPHEALHLLHDDVIAELRCYEHYTLQVISEP